ncbi:MAG: intein-containing adenosylcobalamin-dependent ribonucleoside-diphosphate reductase, partial [Candidatus Colwellbacteria bacterium]|nr:intein-containing adenosylcobalamin-dependent ribonucleoside-diphosphate reductase [Candidatus Colwellbacteria bacterium]
TTVAPTGSISMMYDTSSGVEPNFALAYIKQDKDGLQYQYLNRHFEKELHKRRFNEATIARVKEEIVKTGSIQHLTDLPQDLRDTFVISMDMSGIDHVNMQAAFQKHVDNSISKTVNFSNSATKDDVKQVYFKAWQTGCKSCTVYRDGSRNIQILNLGTGENIASTTGDAVRRKESLNLAIDEGRLEPRVRPDSLSGRTYKAKTGYGNLYVTVNNDEKGVPFEVFATIGKTGGFFQEQSEAICRLISLALRSGVKVEEIISYLKGIRGPMPIMTPRGTILSLPDGIGQILEEHVSGNNGSLNDSLLEQNSLKVGVAAKSNLSLNSEAPVNAARAMADYGFMPGCPECDSPLTMAEGCISCKSCGYSRCV